MSDRYINFIRAFLFAHRAVDEFHRALNHIELHYHPPTPKQRKEKRDWTGTMNDLIITLADEDLDNGEIGADPRINKTYSDVAVQLHKLGYKRKKDDGEA